jgi:DNA-binding transcriptional regulator YiaG
MANMSQRAYARQRGVSVSTVQKAIETGRPDYLSSYLLFVPRLR